MFESHCTICLEPITDPICTHCYIKQAKTWFNDININPIIKNFAIKKIKDRLLLETINETDCIICKNENVNVCFYCFGYITIQTFKELNLPNEMIKNFSEFFNYELMGRDLKMQQIEQEAKMIKDEESDELNGERFLDDEDNPENLDDWTVDFDL